MAATTTWHAIRDRYITLLEAATPDDLVDLRFRRAPRHRPLIDWAMSAGSGALRKFEIMRGDPGPEPEVMDPSAFVRDETTRLTIAYPVDVGLYGVDDLEDLECVMRNDASLVREVVASAGNYLAGQSLAYPDPLPPDRSRDRVWFQEFTVRLIYLEAQTLT